MSPTPAVSRMWNEEIIRRARVNNERRWKLLELPTTRTADQGADATDIARILKGEARILDWPPDAFISTGLHYVATSDTYVIRIASETFAPVRHGAEIPTWHPSIRVVASPQADGHPY